MCNPFYVLGLTPAARPARITLRFRALRDELGRGEALTFSTPLGPQRLDSDLLHQAHAELRDPDLRLEHELRYVPAGRISCDLQVVRAVAQ